MNDVIKNFEALLNQGQDSALLRFGLGSAYFQQQDFAQAAQHFAKAIELDPTYSAAWKNYGKALTANQQIQAAIQVYNQGITVAEAQGDKQAVKEMRVFLKRLPKND